jgi:ABC-2 type transport system permease protein
MIYWPLVDTALWGITGTWLVETSGNAELIVAILTALVLWNIIWRAQQEVARNLMDEIWNNNLVNLFSTPLTTKEWMGGVLLLSVIKTTITLAVIIPIIMLLYTINVFAAGPWMVPFFLIAAMTGWWLGFISAGIVLLYRPKVQTVIWTLPGALLPFSAIYFPLDKLPEAAQVVSRAIPTTYAFESMRSLLLTGIVPLEYIAVAFVLNTIYLVLSLAFFAYSFRKSRELGLGRFI